jgi:hypothetical protein
VTVPAGQTVESASATTALKQVFAAVRPLGLRSVDITNTGDQRLATADHRTAYGIAYLPPGGVFDDGLTARLTDAVHRATPAGYTTSVTGLGPLQSGSGQSGGSGCWPRP